MFKHDVFIRSGNYVSKRFGSRFIRTSFSVPTKYVERFSEAFPKAVKTLKGK